MFFRWLKQYMPRGLYGRTALILVAPVVVLQLVVSVTFIGRHLGDVTTQMSLTQVRALNVLLDSTTAAATREQALARMAPFLAAFDVEVRFIAPEDVPSADRLRWYDFSGRVVRATVRNAMPQTQAVLFPDNYVVQIVFRTDLGPLLVTFNRRRVTAAAPHQLIVTMVFFGALMTVIAFVYMRNQLRPITRLARAAQAFGHGNNLPYRPGGALEVRAAGRAFLDMRERIDRQIEQRTMMLSGVSHDLRTPLTRLKLGLAMLDEEDAAPMLRDVEEMQELLDAFLEFSRGTAEGEPEPVDPAALVGRIVEDAQRGGKAVTLARVNGGGQVMLRPVAMRRAIENLIGNAVRYGTRAEISVDLSETSLRIRIEDDGPGIAEADRQEAVKPFSRLDPARNQDRGSGVGLGLAIVSEIARAHGGVLELGQSARLGGLCADIVIAL